jgi:uncharacterized protein (DUF58 family)
MVKRLLDMQLSVGLAASGDHHHHYRPDSGPEHLGRLMESFAEVRAFGLTPLKEYLYQVQPHLNHFNTVTVITASTDVDWLPSLVALRGQGVDVAAVIIDPTGFGSGSSIEPILRTASANLIPVYVVKRGMKIDHALMTPVNRDVFIDSSRYATDSSRYATQMTDRT